MGSLRSPIGPLPSAIYWRRRGVVLLLVLLLLLLVFWALRAGTSGPAGSSRDDSQGGGPAPSITPGATDTESFIEERPGGQGSNDGDESGENGGDAENGGDSDAENGGDGSGGDGDGDGDTGSAGDGGPGGGDSEADGGADGSGGGAGGVAGLPDCAPGAQIKLSLRSEENSYAPDEEEVSLRITVRNDSGAACKADFGHRALTVVIYTGDDQVWTSEHCPTGRAAQAKAVPAGGTATQVVDWDRRYSSSQECDGPDQPTVPTGTYLAEAELGGFPVAQTSFRLNED